MVHLPGKVLCLGTVCSLKTTLNCSVLEVPDSCRCMQILYLRYFAIFVYVYVCLAVFYVKRVLKLR